MVNIRPRKLLTAARRSSVARAIKHYIVTLVADNNSTMPEVRDKIREHKGVTNLTPSVCESWATGLGMQTLDIELMFADADILQFVIKALDIHVDEQTEDRLYQYGVATYEYDLEEVVDFYWATVGRVLCYC